MTGDETPTTNAMGAAPDTAQKGPEMLTLGFALSAVMTSEGASSTLSIDTATLLAEEQEAVFKCPHCRKPVPHPGYSHEGIMALAECERCDVLFDPSDLMP